MKYLWSLLLTLSLCITTSYAQSGLFIAPSTSTITSPVTGQSWLFNSTNNTVSVYTGSSWLTKSAPFSNLTATTNPTAANDNTQHYVVGSFWINQTTQTLYMATSVATSAAVWVGMNVVTSTIPLANIQQGGATNGQSLIWNNGASVWNPASPAILLSQLLQSGATTGQVATFNGSAWVASNAGAGTVTTISTGNLSPLFTAAIASPTTAPVLSFSLSNCASKSILSNITSGSAAPAYNVLTVTAGTGLTGGGNIADSPTVSLTTPVAVANGGTGAATFAAHTYFGNPTGSTATPAASSIVAADLPTTTVNSITNSSTLVTGAISGQALTISDANAAVPITSGGTGAATQPLAILALIAGSPTTGQALEFNGTNWVPATVSGTGTVTTISTGNLSPLFTASIASPTTAPVLSFALSNAASYAILSNTTSGSAAPAYNVLNVTAGTGLNGGGAVATSPTINLTVPISNSNLGSTVVTSVGGLSPLFTTTLTTQTLGFALSNASAHSFLGNNTGTSAAPAYNVLAAADLPSTTVNTTGNLSPLFTYSITGQALSFSLTNAAGHGILSNTSSSPGAAAYNVLTVTAGTGLTGGGTLDTSPTINLDTPVSVAHGGTGTALLTTGTATFLTAGSVAVVDTSITSGSIVMVTQAGATPAAESFSVVVAATVGFTIYSTNSTSAAVVNYLRIK